MDNVITLLKFARDKTDPEKRAEIITEAQHFLAWGLRSAMTECQEAGAAWRSLGPAIGMPHNVLYRQYRAGGPVVAAEPRYTPEIQVARGFRTVGDVDDRWRVISEDDAADPNLKTATLFFDPVVTKGLPHPFAKKQLEFRYATWPAEALEALGRTRSYLLWKPELGRRPIHMTEAVFDELFGPPDMSSPERKRWESEAARLDQLRKEAGQHPSPEH
ncbi:hypothetical protein [Amycolatopsis sp. NPDC004378]